MCLSPQKVTANHETEKFFPSFSNFSHKATDLRIKHVWVLFKWWDLAIEQDLAKTKET